MGDYFSDEDNFEMDNDECDEDDFEMIVMMMNVMRTEMDDDVLEKECCYLFSPGELGSVARSVREDGELAITVNTQGCGNR